MKYRNRIFTAVLAGLILSSGVPGWTAQAAEQIQVEQIQGEDLRAEEVQVEEITEIPTPGENDVPSTPPAADKMQQSRKFQFDKTHLPELFLKGQAEQARKQAGTESEISLTEAGAESNTKVPLTEPESKSDTEISTTEAESESDTEGSLTEPESESDTEISMTEAESESDTEGSLTEPESETKASETQTEASIEFSPGLYEIISATDAQYLMDVRHCTVSENDFRTVQTFRSLDVNQQKFYIEELPENLWRISVLSTGEAFTASADDTAFSLSAMEHPTDAYAAASQSWALQDAGDGYFYIQSQEGGYVTLDAPEAYSGAAVNLQEFTGKQNQKWLLSKTWISGSDTADTDLVNPYGEDGPCRNLSITLKFGTESEILTSSELAAHTAENESHQYVLDPEFLTSYIDELAARYDTQGQPRRFVTSTEKEITLTEGDFGWKLDTEGTKTLLQENLLSDSPVTLKPVWLHEGTAFTSPEGSINDIGDSYIEVDLTAQKVWLYKNGKLLLESDCVSGTMGTEAQTPSGVYSIYYMQSPAVLNGPGYSSPVTYWMAFYGGFGLHDATWRTEFGGEIFRTDGSHGCVNLPLENAEIVYNTVGIGYPVILYY